MFNIIYNKKGLPMFTPIASNKVSLLIMSQIKESIRTGKLKMGDRLLSERVMSEQLGVSRAAVREAIRAMELMGLVKCIQGEGNFIQESFENNLMEPLSLMFMLNKSKANEIGELRRALEIESVRLTASKITKETVMKLNETIEVIATSDDERARVEADKEFHYIIAKASGNMFIINILNSLSQIIEEQMAGVRENITANKKNIKIITDSHKSIVKALDEGNVDAAIEAMSIHMNSVMEHLDLSK